MGATRGTRRALRLNMNRPFALLFVAGLASALFSTACSQHDDGPGSHGDGIDSTDPSSSSSIDDCGVEPDQPVNAIAMSLDWLTSYEEAENGSGGSSASSGSGGGTGPDPSTIVIQLTNRTYTCDAPVLSSACSDTATWQVSIQLAPSRLAPGTFDLSDPSLNAFYSFTSPSLNGDTNDCEGGGGSFLGGKMVIDHVDDSAVHFHLTGTNGNDADDGLAADGAYIAVRCESLP